MLILEKIKAGGKAGCLRFSDGSFYPGFAALIPVRFFICGYDGFFADGSEDIEDHFSISIAHFRCNKKRFTVEVEIVEVQKLIIITSLRGIRNLLGAAIIIGNIDNSAITIFKIDHPQSAENAQPDRRSLSLFSVEKGKRPALRF